jgi:hypothetical protein
VLKLLISSAFAAATMLGCSCAYAMGGGNSSPIESPYAILEPQTVAPQAPAEPNRIEGRSAFENGGLQSYGAAPRHHRRSRERPAPSDR